MQNVELCRMQNAELAENRMQNACCAELQKCRKITECRIAETAENRMHKQQKKYCRKPEKLKFLPPTLEMHIVPNVSIYHQ